MSEDIAAIWQAFSGLRGKTDRGKNLSKHGARCFLESEKYGEGAYIDFSEHCNQGLSTGHQGSGRRHLTALTLAKDLQNRYLPPPHCQSCAGDERSLTCDGASRSTEMIFYDT